MHDGGGMTNPAPVQACLWREDAYTPSYTPSWHCLASPPYIRRAGIRLRNAAHAQRRGRPRTGWCAMGFKRCRDLDLDLMPIYIALLRVLLISRKPRSVHTRRDLRPWTQTIYTEHDLAQSTGQLY